MLIYESQFFKQTKKAEHACLEIAKQIEITKEEIEEGIEIINEGKEKIDKIGKE